jgi:hypothetical protein
VLGRGKTAIIILAPTLLAVEFAVLMVVTYLPSVILFIPGLLGYL